jgi:hypothetical protein
MSEKPKRIEVADHELRRMFNEGRYWERMNSGEFFEVLYREGHPSPKDSREPPCTRSQIIAYVDARGRQIAVVHQYVRKDGALGGSGRPDPKKLFHRGHIYVLS